MRGWVLKNKVPILVREGVSASVAVISALLNSFLQNLLNKNTFLYPIFLKTTNYHIYTSYWQLFKKIPTTALRQLLVEPKNVRQLGSAYNIII